MKPFVTIKPKDKMPDYQMPPNLIVRLSTHPDSPKTAAEMFNTAVERWPSINRASFWVREFDGDDREIDEIPEACQALEEFARLIGFDGIGRFKFEHAVLLFTCLGLGRRVGNYIMVPREVTKFLKEYIW